MQFKFALHQPVLIVDSGLIGKVISRSEVVVEDHPEETREPLQYKVKRFDNPEQIEAWFGESALEGDIPPEALKANGPWFATPAPVIDAPAVDAPATDIDA